MTTLFNYDPYYDDFDEDKNFMRVLFRPGYSVQARELTQLQTILANQIEKFGNHIFKSGSPIIGGKISLDRKANYIILNPQYNNSDIAASDFVGKTIISYNSSKNVRAKVIAVDTTTANPILVVKYLSGDVFSESDELKILGTSIYAQLKTTNAVGGSFVASLQEGVYYFKGQFVKVVPQFLIVELFYRIGYGTSTINSKPSYKIGIEFAEQILDEVDDTSLLDPAQDAFNYQAPGATRFQIATSLSKRTLDSSDTSTFFEIVRLVDDVKTKEIDYAVYSELEKTMARRTYDESGNYTVDPFVISLDEGDSANGKFNVVLDPGKAYVGGYEFETIAPTTIEIDRARQVATANIDLPTNYESSLVLDSVRGTLDITTFPSLDIHSVPHASISVASLAQYNSTKIGTVRADMIRYNDSTSSAIGNTHSFTVNTFDASTTPITGTIPSTGSSTTTIKIPSTFNSSLPLNAYANMYFRITDAGGTSIAPILITSSNTVTMNLAYALPWAPASNTVSIESDLRNAESLVSSDGTFLSFAGNINTDSKDPTTGFVSINEPKRSALIFSTPTDAIKGGSITKMDLYARKLYANRPSSPSGEIIINAGGTDTFGFATSGTVPDSLILDNIICFVRSDTTPNAQYAIAPNTVISLANNLYSVTASSPTQIKINVGAGSAKVDLLITTKLNDAVNPSTGSTRGKQLIPVSTNVDLHAKVPYEMGGTNTLVSGNTAGAITYFTGGAVFTSIGATNFTESAILTDLRTPGKVVSLQVPDVYELVGIYDSKNTGANVSTATLTSAYDITTSYEFDNGQRKTHYDHATIKLKRGHPAPTGCVFVQYKYLSHIAAPASGGNGLFTVDSYLQTGSNFTYGDISLFANADDNKLTSLRGSFDFRPTRAIGGNNLSGALNPEPLEQIGLKYEYYMPRIDQVIVKSSKEFAVIQGASAVNPIAPPVKPEDMLIYTLTIPAYTETVKDVRADFKNHRRYTMSDINSFEDRIRGLEYYVSLSTLEKDAASTKVLDGNGLERSKYGILVDNFTSKDNQATKEEVGYDNRNLISSGKLYPASLMRTVNMRANTSSSSGAVKFSGTGTKKVMTVNFTGQEFVKQPYATKSVPIANALFAGFKGTTKLFPEFTGDVDTGSTAKVTLNSTKGLDTAFNFINGAFKYIADNNPTWNLDKDSPFAQIADSQWYQTLKETDTDKSKIKVEKLGGGYYGHVAPVNDNTYLTAGAELKQKQISTSSSQVDVGTFVTDLAIQPYMKSKQILFSSQGMRPSTVFYNFFDDVAVNKYIVVPNKVTLNTTSTLMAGEAVLIANTIADLTANLASLLTGGTSYDPAFVVVNETGSANVSIINETGKPLTSKYVYGLDSGNYYTVSSVDDHRSGAGTITGATITLQSDASSTDNYYNGNTISIIHASDSFEGLGEQFTVSDYDGASRTVTLSGTPTATGLVVYSIGTNKSNKLGQVGGAFYMPKATFRSGQRNFRTTESFNNTYDADAISFSDKTYVSSGMTVNKTTLVDTVLNVDVDFKVVGTQTTNRLISSTVSGSIVLDKWRPDPLAETFFVDSQVYPYGVFMDSADLFFRAKDDENIPVTIQIRPTVNAMPSSDYWYPESVVVKYPSEINVSESPSVADSTTATNFKFSTPVYLKPGVYALVVISDSPDYIVWEAEKGGTTTKNEFVDKQPYLGTLYKSQNAMEFVPFLNEDLMFRLNRCKFTTNTVANFSIYNDKQDTTYNVDKFRLIETSIIPSESVTSLTHSITTTTVQGVKETTPRAISPSQTYYLADDDLYAVKYRRKLLGEQNDFTVNITMSTTDDTVSPVVSEESLYLNIWENFIDNAEINSSDFTIVAPGSGYSNANTITITSASGIDATANLHVDANGNVLSVYVSNVGEGYLDDFDISYYTHPTTPATIVLNSEYDSSGGPCLARYITKPITLADGYDAGDLRVFLGANKPGTSEVAVFYKLLSDTDGTKFADRPYQKMVCINPTTTPSLDETFRDYEYRPSATENAVSYTGENGVKYDTFKTFAIKIVLTSSDPAIVPSVKDLRIIATPAE